MLINGYAAYGSGNGYMGSGLAPHVSRFGPARDAAAHPQPGVPDHAGISRTFAQDVVRRIQAHPLPRSEARTPDAGQSAQDGLDTLEQSLARAVDHIRSNFGNAAAQATMGLVYKEVGNGPVSEDSLGQGLLQALRFVDRNFGFAAGDRLMAFFNSDLNKAVNEYFDNGLMEVFYAAGPGNGAAAGQGMAKGLEAALGQALGYLAQEYATDAAKTLVEQFLAALEQGEGPFAALRRAVDATGQELAGSYGGDAREHATVLGQALAPLLQEAPVEGNSVPRQQMGMQVDTMI